MAHKINPMKGFIWTASGRVSSNWIDQNGHMTIATYMPVFDQGTATLLQKFGLTFPEPTADLTMVVGRIFIEHKKELLEGEEWELWSGFISVNSTSVNLTHRLRSGASLRTVCDMRATAFSRTTRKSATLDQAIIERITSMTIPGIIDRFER